MHILQAVSSQANRVDVKLKNRDQRSEVTFELYALSTRDVCRGYIRDADNCMRAFTRLMQTVSPPANRAMLNWDTKSLQACYCWIHANPLSVDLHALQNVRPASPTSVPSRSNLLHCRLKHHSSDFFTCDSTCASKFYLRFAHLHVRQTVSSRV